MKDQFENVGAQYTIHPPESQVQDLSTLQDSLMQKIICIRWSSK